MWVCVFKFILETDIIFLDKYASSICHQKKRTEHDHALYFSVDTI